MRRSILLVATLAGGMTLAAPAEAEGRFDHRAGQAHMFHHSQQFAPPSSLRLFAPRHPVRGFADWCQPSRFSHRRPVVRFIGPRPAPPLNRQPGFRILAGRQILPFARVPLAPRVFVVRPSYHFPTFVRVVPSPGFAPRRDILSMPHARGGLTIIVRDPAGMPPWQ